MKESKKTIRTPARGPASVIRLDRALIWSGHLYSIYTRNLIPVLQPVHCVPARLVMTDGWLRTKWP